MLAGTRIVKQPAAIDAMTIDVEDYFHTLALAGAVSRSDWHRLPSRVEMNTDRLLELFEQQQVQATFFMLGWVAERFPKLVYRIAEAGHEIGCYGFHHQSAHDQLPTAFREETRRAKHLLEDLSGQPIDGYRAVNCSVTRSSLWVLDVLVDLGFKWDASIYPIYHD
ncbi:MAG: polysaccharide deacetylase family protein, partial [Saccharospirillum sp.]